MVKLALSHRVIVNTRPAHQATPLNKWIIAEGGKVISFPTITICPPTDHRAFINALHHVQHCDVAIFLSANAVLAVADNHFTLPADITVIAIGPGTAQALKTHLHIDAQTPPQYNSEGILSMLQLSQFTSKNIALFCGDQPRPLLKQTLFQRGINVHEIICYQRCIPNVNLNNWVPKLIHSHADLIICTSAQSLLNLQQILQNTAAQHWLTQTPLLVISQPMAELSKKLGVGQTLVIADNASDSAIQLATLTHFDVQ